MKRFAAIVFSLIFSCASLLSTTAASYAQIPTATSAALSPIASVSPVLSELPTMFPTVTPVQPAFNTTWPILPQFDELAIPSNASASPTASVSADQLTPGYSEDYCLDVPVIMYHHIEPLSIASQLGHEPLTVDPSYFENHIRYLLQHEYHIIALGDLVTALRNHGTLPEKSVVLTVDDGYIDDYTYGFMLAKKYHVIINFMIPTGLIGQPDYMTWDHVKEMAASPYARLYNHTTTHAPLGLIDKDKIIQEVGTANTDLEKHLGIHNDIVIYPYGSYSDLAIQTLQEMGMVAAVSTDPGRNECTSSIMKLPRVRAGNAPLSEYGF